MPKGHLRRSLSPFGRLVPGYRRELEEALVGLPVGHPLEYHERIGSTNERAKAWARDGAPAGALVVADLQTAGRGRFGRRWVAPTGSSILASVILRPTVAVVQAPLVTLAWATGTREALADVTGRAVQVKWPNDLVFEGRKIAGILTESILSQDGIDALVVGFGVNVNQEPGEDVQGGATSLRILAGREFGRGEVLRRILEAGHRSVGLLEREGPEGILDLLRRHSSILGRDVTLVLGGESHSGRAVDIDSDGRLVLETDRGLFRASAGEVTTRRDLP